VRQQTLADRGFERHRKNTRRECQSRSSLAIRHFYPTNRTSDACVMDAEGIADLFHRARPSAVGRHHSSMPVIGLRKTL